MLVKHLLRLMTLCFISTPCRAYRKDPRYPGKYRNLPSMLYSTVCSSSYVTRKPYCRLETARSTYLWLQVKSDNDLCKNPVAYLQSIFVAIIDYKSAGIVILKGWLIVVIVFLILLILPHWFVLIDHLILLTLDYLVKLLTHYLLCSFALCFFLLCVSCLCVCISMGGC